jgi:ADP-ribose pyrophosphatase YjhB (NUDIX family)
VTRLLPPALHRLLLRFAHRARHHWRRATKRPLAGVSVIATDGGGGVLLVRHSYGPRVWALPGGGLARGEAPEAAAVRELREELGCGLARIEQVATLEETISGAPHTAYIFTGTLAGEPRPDAREVVAARFFAVDALPVDLGASSRRWLEAWRAARSSPPLYDTIGIDYADLRRPDPRIARVIVDALGPAETVLNVGAGTGSYEPAGRHVTAVEPSAEMIRQRAPFAAPAIQARAEELPFPDKSFDAAMAVLTVHHWTDQAKGLAEMRRVARGPVVLLTFDPAFRDAWLLEYFPALATLGDRQMPVLADYAKWLGPVEIVPVAIPHDCSDGFLYAHWRRPRAYLDPRIREGMSSFRRIGDLSAGLARLEDDLDSGAWAARHGHLLELDACDLGYRLVVTT